MECVSILLNPQRKSHWFPTKIMIFQNVCWELSIVPHFLRRQKIPQISGPQPDPLPTPGTLFRPFGPRSWQQRHRILEVPIPGGHDKLRLWLYNQLRGIKHYNLYDIVRYRSQQLQLVHSKVWLLIYRTNKRWRVFSVPPKNVASPFHFGSCNLCFFTRNIEVWTDWFPGKKAFHKQHRQPRQSSLHTTEMAFVPGILKSLLRSSKDFTLQQISICLYILWLHELCWMFIKHLHLQRWGSWKENAKQASQTFVCAAYQISSLLNLSWTDPSEYLLAPSGTFQIATVDMLNHLGEKGVQISKYQLMIK